MFDLDDLAGRMSEIEATLRAELYDPAEFGEPRQVEFGLYLPFTKSPTELIDALNAFVQLTTAAAGLAAYAHPQLNVPVGRGIARSMSSLVERVERRRLWELELTHLAVGSIHVKLKPKGRHIKRVTHSPAGVLPTIAALCAIGSFGFQVADHVETPHLTAHPGTAIVYVLDRTQQMAWVRISTRGSEVIARLPLRARVTMTVQMGDGKTIIVHMEGMLSHSHATTSSPH